MNQRVTYEIWQELERLRLQRPDRLPKEGDLLAAARDERNPLHFALDEKGGKEELYAASVGMFVLAEFGKLGGYIRDLESPDTDESFHE